MAVNWVRGRGNIVVHIFQQNLILHNEYILDSNKIYFFSTKDGILDANRF